MSTKNSVLALLEKSRDSYLSGEEIAGALGVSRSAVWKAVGSLKTDGYEISAVKNRGYTLSIDSNILSIEGILPYLKTRDASNDIRVYEELESTNKTAKKLAVSGSGHGTVVIADCQTAGKGHRGKSFYSPPALGLYMSAIINPSLYSLPTIIDITRLSAAVTAKSITDVCGITPAIKPINDLFINDKKVCGILTEAVSDLESGAVDWAVVGIGVNVGGYGFSAELKNIATSLFFGSPKKNIRNRLAAEIINNLLYSTEPAFIQNMLSLYESLLIR
ncbi:MAG: biotin--[acetyl-CoA-carboxylase] ligase [Clostridiales bacterium]|jgi:BirA family biotin operon repressor/biotin-[acetyl-CoA-carboxylase] ligase|nr:biotin--[acetyl-CoA-carboxylase] ligase [Clostridiales bacterium]